MKTNKIKETDIEYLEKEFPKGETKFRGQAMVLLALAREQGIKQTTADFIKIIESKELLEKLSDLEHQQWSHLAKYLINLIEDDKSVYEKLEDWKSLAYTDYSKLSEESKEKDRKFARLVIEEIKKQMLVEKK
jgi:hypothetical protein